MARCTPLVFGTSGESTKGRMTYRPPTLRRPILPALRRPKAKSDMKVGTKQYSTSILALQPINSRVYLKDCLTQVNAK